MRIFKKMDLSIQALLIIAFTLVSFTKMDRTFLTGYLVVALWQLISIVVHFINKWHPVKGGKR